jgi:SAM-dependent methyltransferase
MNESQMASQPMPVSTAQVPAARSKLYQLDAATCDLLMASAPLMAEWSRSKCKPKSRGGMEQWAKKQNDSANGGQTLSCDWYHGTWQYMRLLNMVAVPPWYGFYSRALGSVLDRKRQARVLISACADCGMLATLHQAVVASGATPTIIVCDICATPLLNARWYAERNGFAIECICDNILSTPSLAPGSFDLIVTDEFLTVLPAGDKPAAVARWKELLKPGGVLVTTAMIGGATTPELRKRYAERARRLLRETNDGGRIAPNGGEELIERLDRFAQFHTRHMIVDENEIRRLFSDFYLGFLVPTATPGECVNPTHSFQIVASLPHPRRTVS